MPEAYEELVEIAMGGTALKAMLDEIDLDKLIADLQQESEDARGQREKKLLKRLKVLEGMQVRGRGKDTETAGRNQSGGLQTQKTNKSRG